ncbi:SDR family oxidoreductase [Hymenobacter koreensis]|uniref:SDR family oxidoreductase n=1 Tax=Hymenobacter koreensis TaxID=1084523 RepID=A0ABP8J5A4_9BACT
MSKTFSSEGGVAVIGCGWLGLPLARTLVAAGYSVAGSTTSPHKLPLLVADGIRPHELSLSSETPAAAVQPVLAGCSVLVLNVPPGQRRAAVPDLAAYPASLQAVADALPGSSIRHVVFVSSTGVYPDDDRTMTEDDAVAAPDGPSSLLRAEYLFQQPAKQPWQTTVLRLGGLMGPGRPPGRFLAGRSDLPQPEAPVNMLHQADAVGIIQAVITQHGPARTLNVCAPSHPSRRAFYSAAAAYLGLPAPQFRHTDHSSGKLIATERLHEALRYPFRHPDPIASLGFCA